MSYRPRTRFLIATCGLLAFSSLACGSSADKCGDLQSYTASVTTPYSFATDIHPIMSDTTAQVGCAQAQTCHGNPSVFLDTGLMKTLVLTEPAATVRTALLQQVPVNAPSMKLVVPGNVGASFLAYKLSGADGLACVNAMCVSGASIGIAKPCGDPMPMGGILSAADRTKILDWIKQGAAE